MEKGTTAIGFVNDNGQVVIRNTGKPGTDHRQKIYQLGCSKCGFVYGANGTDIHERKCPECQNGEPGLELDAHPTGALPCYISDGAEILLEVVLPDSVFKATMRKPCTLNISTKSGDARTASLHFLT